MAAKVERRLLRYSQLIPQSDEQDRENVFKIFRRWGYLQASLDPLGQYLPPEPFPITCSGGRVCREARELLLRHHCCRVHASCRSGAAAVAAGADGAHRLPTADQEHILTQLIRADIFEQVIQSRYLGTKRFSLEGLTVLIPFLDRVLESKCDRRCDKRRFLR